jgi:hypothetical protein
MLGGLHTSRGSRPLPSAPSATPLELTALRWRTHFTKSSVKGLVLWRTGRFAISLARRLATVAGNCPGVCKLVILDHDARLWAHARRRFFARRRRVLASGDRRSTCDGALKRLGLVAGQRRRRRVGRERPAVGRAPETRFALALISLAFDEVDATELLGGCRCSGTTVALQGCWVTVASAGVSAETPTPSGQECRLFASCGARLSTRSHQALPHHA